METLVNNLDSLLLLPLLIIISYESMLFILATILKNNGLADVGWGLGFVIVAWATYFLNYPQERLELFAAILISIWGVRLFLHIGLRNIGKSEDFRYQSMRKSWGNLILLKSFLYVFMLQGVLMYVISLPIIFLNTFSINSNFTPLVWLGFIVFSIGILFETVADWQLSKFVSLKKKGFFEKDSIITKGLWKYSRHPNYFGEALLWWGIYFIALEQPYAWISVVGPITIGVLVRYVSGVPLLEKKYMKNQKFKEYAQKTSVFIPLPPKR